MYKLLYTPRPAIDAKWFKALIPYNEELFTALGASHQQIAEYREQFDSKPFNPDLRPKDINITSYEQRNRELLQLLQALEQEETNDAIVQAYRLKILELIDQNSLLIASARNDMETFGELNRTLYGTPSAAILADACDWLRQTAHIAHGSSIAQINQASEAVLRNIPDLNGSTRNIIPDSHVFKRVRDRHFESGGYIEQLFGEVNIPDHVTAASGDPVTRKAIKNIGSEYLLIDSTDELWGVVHSQKAVVRPVGLDVSREGFMGIIAHEVGSHLLERQNGLRQPLRLLSIGLDRYDSLNEGRAFLREQIMFNSPDQMLGKPDWEYIILLYISTALASGVYRQPYDFMSLYTTMYPVCLMFQSMRLPDNPVYAERKAKDEAWHLCVRAGKGTDGNGGAYLKSHVYLTGNLIAWELATQDPDLVFLGDAGKFDYSRQDHRSIINTLDIKPNFL